MVEELSQMIRSLQRVVNGDSVMRRYTLTYSTVFCKLSQMVSMACNSNRCLLKNKKSFEIAFDN